MISLARSHSHKNKEKNLQSSVHSLKISEGHGPIAKVSSLRLSFKDDGTVKVPRIFGNFLILGVFLKKKTLCQ